MSPVQPPRALEWLLARLLPGDARGSSMLGDLRESLTAAHPAGGWRAHLWYAREAAGLALRYGPGQVRAALGRSRRWTGIDLLRYDLRFALRSLRQQPGLLLVALLTLAIGTGATTLVFSAVNALLLRPLPVHEFDRLVTVLEERRGPNNTQMGRSAFTYGRYLEYRNAARGALSGLAAETMNEYALRGAAGAEMVTGAVVSGNYFEVLGVRPAVGRFFTAALDERGGAEPMVVISHQLWQRRFGGEPSVLGRTVHVNGRPLSVIGVAPAGFNGTMTGFQFDVWLPAAQAAARDTWMVLFGRLADGVTLERARAQLNLTGPRIPTERPGLEVDAVVLQPMTGFPLMRMQIAAFIAILLTTTALVLFIVAINLASMLLARAVARRRELAVRLALGCSRARLARQLVLETLLLFGLGSAAGLAVTVVAARAIGRVAVLPQPRIALDLTPDARVFTFGVLLTLLVGLAAALAPVFQATRHNLFDALRPGAATGDRRATRLRSILVIGQVAATVVVLVAGSLFMRSLDRAVAVPTGYDPRNTVVAHIALSAHGYDAERARRFFTQLHERLAARPEISVTGAALTEPLSHNTNNMNVNRADRFASGEGALLAQFGYVNDTWFEAAGTEIVAGRSISAAEVRANAPVAVINQTLADRLWPEGNALGQRLVLNGEREVVGIARDGRYQSLGDQRRSYVYLPLAPGTRSARIYVRSRTDARAALAALREEVAALDPDVGLSRASTLARHLALFSLPYRIAATFIGGFGIIGLLIATLGIYGVVNLQVVNRTRELGIRFALGARHADVIRPVLGEGARLALFGIAIGAVFATAVSWVIRSFLFGARLSDGLAAALAPLILIAAALLASWLPARRAARIDPLQALRAD